MASSLNLKKYFIAFNLMLLTTASQGQAAWILKDGWVVNSKEAATLSVSEHYELGIDSLNSKNWQVAADNFKIVATCFPRSTYAQDANYYLGVALFQLEEFDFANDAFSEYIGAKNHPKYFIEAIEYKFCVAEAFKKGANRRFFSKKQLPKWASGQDLGLTIYDEVIAALPSHEFAVRSLYSKACLLLQMKQYKESIDSLQLLVKRFPKHQLAPESYMLINNIYLEQCKAEFQNPDFLAFAEINLRRFKAEFPRENKVTEAENSIQAIKEVFAKGLYETGQFYERIEEPRASIIYYQNAISQFPDTAVARLCEQRLSRLKAGR